MADGDWESILEQARKLDASVAAGQGVEASAALGLARAVLEFQRRIGEGSVRVPPEIAPAPERDE